MNHVARFDRGTIKGDAIVTDEGYIKANAVVTRTGIFLYQNPDGTIRKELRHPDDVWQDASIESIKLIPITNNHPIEKLISAENSKRLKIGYTGETVIRDDPHVLANIVITDQEGVDAVIKFGRKELSLGYTVDLEETPGEYEGEKYDARQKNIRYNHLAIVDKARAGSEARIALDSQDAIEIYIEVVEMSKRKMKIDNEEVIVEETAASYIEKLLRDLENLEEEKNRVEEEIKIIAEKLEKAEGERDSSRDIISSMEMKAKEMNSDSESFKRAVSDRIKLYKIADRHLDSSVIAKLDSMSDLEIKKQIIKTCRKSINLDGKSHVYLDAMFDTILDDESYKKVNVENVKYNSENKLDSGDYNPVESRKKMMLNMKNIGAK